MFSLPFLLWIKNLTLFDKAITDQIAHNVHGPSVGLPVKYKTI